MNITKLMNECLELTFQDRNEFLFPDKNTKAVRTNYIKPTNFSF
jgi:hypothetical protein